MVQNEEAKDFCANNDFNNVDPIFEELDVAITESEVQTCIKSLKHDKSSGSGNILNAYETGDILSSRLTDLFSLISDTDYFSESWSDIFIPVFKTCVCVEGCVGGLAGGGRGDGGGGGGAGAVKIT